MAAFVWGLVRVGIEDRHNVRVVKQRGGGGFLLESLDPLRPFGRERLGQNLQRHAPKKPHVLSFVDDAHSPPADALAQTEGSEHRPWTEGLNLLPARQLRGAFYPRPP